MNDGQGGEITLDEILLDFAFNGGRRTARLWAAIELKQSGGVTDPGNNPNEVGGGGFGSTLDEKSIYVRRGGGVDGVVEKEVGQIDERDLKNIELRRAGGVTDPPSTGEDAGGSGEPIVFKGTRNPIGIMGPIPRGLIATGGSSSLALAAALQARAEIIAAGH